MAVHEFLAPDENIRFSSKSPVDFMGEQYDFHITNKRLIWHKQTGLIFKKNNFVAEMIERVKSLQFKEEGLIFKKGTIVFSLGDRKKEFSGDLRNIRALYNEIQSLMDIEVKE